MSAALQVKPPVLPFTLYLLGEKRSQQAGGGFYALAINCKHHELLGEIEARLQSEWLGAKGSPYHKILTAIHTGLSA